VKLLPNIVPEVSDLDKVKKEEFEIKKDEKSISSNEANIETNEIDFIVPTDAPELASGSSYEDKDEEVKGEIISSVDDDTTPEHNEIVIDQYESAKMTSTSPMMTSSTNNNDVEIMIVERKDLEKTVNNVLNTFTTEKFDVTVFEANENLKEKENLNLNLSNGGQLFGSPLHIYHKDDDDEDNDEKKTTIYDDDYSIETIKPARPTEYSHRQKSLPSSTLLHGFIANPGYPSFYVGKTNECKWKIKINEAQTIALTILDLHLRSKIRKCEIFIDFF
jgi:hypothetical protein